MSLPPLTVLLVEDDPEVRDVLFDLLDLEGVRVICADHGAAAWELLNRADCPQMDAIVSDIAMPKMNGFQLLAKLRSSPAFSAIPFILISGNPDRARAEASHSSAYAPDDFFPKPFEVRSLIDRIQALIESSDGD